MPLDDDERESLAEFYDGFGLYADRPDVGFFVSEAVASGGPVLELGCGTGRVLLPTARAGIAIWGLDLSKSMLDRCREKLALEPTRVQRLVTLRQGDMRAFDFDWQFRLVTLPFRPFQHLIDVEDQLACLACVHRALEEGGRLIVDVFNPSLPALLDESRSREQPGGEPFTLPDGRRVVRKERIAGRDFLRQVIDVELIYEVTDAEGRERRLVHAIAMRYFFRFELEHLLARCGFSVERAYSDYNRSPLGATDSGELVYVAVKT